MSTEVVAKTFRLPPTTWDNLELFRQTLQRTLPFRVTSAAALSIAVSSATAAFEAGNLPLPQPKPASAGDG